MAAGFRPTRVYLEVGSKRVLACSVDWPGWCRSGRDEEVALAALASYAPRYAPVAAAAGMPFDESAGDELDVVETVSGDNTTNFGVPSQVPRLDAEPLTGADARRQAALVAGAWSVLDAVVVDAPEPPVPNGWPPRYAARRIAWHVLDHAWEIEDKSEREDG